MKNYDQITEEIREIAKKLLEEKTVDKVIGFGLGTINHEMTPLFISNPEDAKRLVFNKNSDMSLTKYLLNYKNEDVAIVAKPCDSRAINTYLSENIVDRNDIKVIGIQGCPGIEGNTACLECEVRNAVISDYDVGEKISEEKTNQLKEDKDKDFDSLSPEEKLKYFQNEFERCTRCYACREACYVCYCKECFTDSNQPEWLGKGVSLNENFTYHLMRAMHMAGRCVNCGACELACPEGIDVRALAAKMYNTATQIFDYKVGMDKKQKTLLAEYDVHDSEKGFME